MTGNQPADVARPMGAQEIGAGCGRVVAQEAFDAHESLQQFRLLRVVEAGQQGQDFLAGTLIQRRKRLAARVVQPKVQMSCIARCLGCLDEPALFQSSQQATEVAGIEVEGARERCGSERRVIVGMSQFPQEPTFGQIERGLQQPFVQDADPARVEAVEAANGFHTV